MSNKWMMIIAGIVIAYAIVMYFFYRWAKIPVFPTPEPTRKITIEKSISMEFEAEELENVLSSRLENILSPKELELIRAEAKFKDRSNPVLTPEDISILKEIGIHIDDI